MHDAEKQKKISQLCQSLGAEKKQADVMADQLLKRSGQLALERNISEVEALDHLLRLLISGREGIAPPHPPSPEGSDKSEN